MRMIPFLSAALLALIGPSQVFANSLRVELDCNGEPLHFIEPGDQDKVTLVLHNDGHQPIEGVLALSIREQSDHPFTRQSMGKIRIKPGQSLRRPVPAAMIGKKLGMRYLEWSFTPKDGSEQTGRKSMALLEPVGITPIDTSAEFLFGNQGMGYHPAEERFDWGIRENSIRLAALSGAKIMRMSPDWEEYNEQSRGYRWDRFDKTLDMLDQYGMEAQVLIAYGGQWWAKSDQTRARMKQAGDHPGGSWRYPPRIDLWRDWVRQVAIHGKGRVRFYEIWNEPDLPFFKGTPEEYVELLKAAYEEIKAVDPDAQVMTGGIGYMGHADYRPEILEAILTHGKDYFDIQTHHAHHATWGFMEELESRLLPLREKHEITQPLYFNETAMSRSFALEHEQSLQATQVPIYAWSKGAIAWHWFIAWNPPSTTGSESGYHMFNPDFTPRPVWMAYNNSARLLSGRHLVKQIDIGTGRFAYLFNGKGTFTGQGSDDQVVVIWNLSPELADEPLVFDIGNARAWVSDWFGNREELPVLEGRVAITATTETRYLVLEGVTGEVEYLGPLLTVENVVRLEPQTPTPIGATLHNPFGKTRAFEVAWSAGIELTVLPPRVSKVRVPAGQSVTVEPTVTLKQPLERDKPVLLRGEMSVVGTSWSGRMELPIQSHIGIDGTPAPDSLARFLLDQSTQVDSLVAESPDTIRFKWTGPADLSAKAWLWREGGMLKLRVDVTDDTHSAPFEGADIWQADSLQVAIAVPGQPGFWELGAAFDDRGRVQKAVWLTPRNMNDPTDRFDATVQRVNDVLRYEITLPLKMLGLNDDNLAKGFGFNFAINDTDENGVRGSAIRLAEGMVINKDSTRFPVFRFDEASGY